MSLALYRKYRPQTFAEVVGQDHVTGPLQQALRGDRVHHAYLFSGPRGCGKTSSARILARSLNCEQGPTPDPCGKCDQCVAIADGTSLDVVEIDAASHGGVDDARDLRERAFFSPVSARYKVYIVDEAHMVTSAGFNALLKVVEEPPEYLKFIFATTEPQQVIATIKSRTHHYPFRLVPPAALTEHLAKLAEQEGVTVDARALSLVVRAGGGSVRDALSVLDQLLAGAGSEGVTYELARSLLGVTDAALLDEMIDAFAAHDGKAVFGTVARVIDAGHDPRRFASDLLDRCKDLIVVQRAPQAVDEGLLDCPPDLVPRLAQQAASLGPAELSRAADLLYAGLTEMRGTTSPRLVLELICARILLPGAGQDEAALLARMERLERRFDIAGDAPAVAAARRAKPAPEPEPAAQAAAPEPVTAALPEAPPEPKGTKGEKRAPAPPAPPGSLDAAAVRRAWPEVLDVMKGPGKRTPHALLQSAQVTDLVGNELTLCFTTSALARQWEKGPNDAVLQEALREVLGVEWRIKSVFKNAQGDCDEPGVTGNPGVDSFAPGDAAADEPAEGESQPAADAPTGEDPALALLRSGLGAKVISEQ